MALETDEMTEVQSRSNDVSKFADNTRIGRLIRSDSDTIALEADLDKMNECANRWQIQFNIN